MLKSTFACGASSLGAPDALCLGLVLLGTKASYQVINLQRHVYFKGPADVDSHSESPC